MTLPRPRVILYLENNTRLREIVKEVLEFAGWHVKESTDSIYTLAIPEASKEHFDLLWFDREARGFDGLELTRRVRRMAHRKGTPVVLISIEDIEQEAREAGADAFLRKPYNLIELVDTIRSLFVGCDGKT